MTTTTERRPPAAQVRPAGAVPIRLIRAELLKIWTTNTWWIMGIIMLVLTGLTLMINIFEVNGQLAYAEQASREPMPTFGKGELPPGEPGPSPEQMREMEQQYLASIDVARLLVNGAANVFTSGQLFNLMFMVILGALIVTNEFFHQTATTTFLTTPHRTHVILSKLVAAVLLAAGFWAAFTAINLGVGSLNFGLNGYAIPLSEWPVVRSVLMNLLAYVIWAVLGVGLGVLIRSQLGATLTAAALYWISWPAAFVLFGVIRQFIIKEDWVWNGVVALPGVASYIMISPERLQFSFNTYGPPWWVGAIVLGGYGVVAGVVGTLITRKRDIS